MLELAIKAEVLDLSWPLEVEEDALPSTLVVLDFIEFCYRIVAKPIQGYHHQRRKIDPIEEVLSGLISYRQNDNFNFIEHHHLEFDKKKGECEFREEINRIFSRNGLAYELKDNGKIERLAPPILHESLYLLILILVMRH